MIKDKLLGKELNILKDPKSLIQNVDSRISDWWQQGRSEHNIGMPAIKIGDQRSSKVIAR